MKKTTKIFLIMIPPPSSIQTVSNQKKKLSNGFLVSHQSWLIYYADHSKLIKKNVGGATAEGGGQQRLSQKPKFMGGLSLSLRTLQILKDLALKWSAWENFGFCFNFILGFCFEVSFFYVFVFLFEILLIGLHQRTSSIKVSSPKSCTVMIFESQIPIL